MGHGEKAMKNARIPTHGMIFALYAHQDRITKSVTERAGLMRIATAVPRPKRTNRKLPQSSEGAIPIAAVRIRAERHVSHM